jgi:hypothetical protein
MEELAYKCDTHPGAWCQIDPPIVGDTQIFAFNIENLQAWEDVLPESSARSCSDPSAWAPGIALGSYKNGPRVFAQVDPSPGNNEAMCFLSVTNDSGATLALYKFSDLSAGDVSGCHTDLRQMCNELGLTPP